MVAIEKPVTKQFHRYASNLKRLRRSAIAEVAEDRKNVCERGGALHRATIGKSGQTV